MNTGNEGVLSRNEMKCMELIGQYIK